MIAYMISDGRGAYIRKDFAGKYSVVRNETLADTWEERGKAKNILKNQLNKNIRNRYHIVEIEIPDVKKIVDNTMNVSTHHTEMVKRISSEEIEDDQIDKWESGITSLSDFIRDLEERREKLNEKLSDVDKEIVDIEHYIELGSKFNAYEGWLAFNMLRHRLKKRRKIKNELHIITQLSECKIDSSMISNLRNVIRELNDRVYTPRKLNDLFQKDEDLK